MSNHYTENEFTPLPLFPPRSPSHRLRHFDEDAYRTDSSSLIFKIVDALAGDGGAGDLKKNIMMQRLAQQADTIYFRDLDRLFSSSIGLLRTPQESYSWDPESDLLTTEQWNEVIVKDSWFRERARDYLKALSLGGTPEGMRMVVHSVLGVDSDIFEIWRFIDQLGINPNEIEGLSRSGGIFRNEVVIRPHAQDVSPRNIHHLYKVISQIKPADSVVTIDTDGLAIHREIPIKGVGADSSYFEVTRSVIGSNFLLGVPPPEYLAEDVIQSELWLKPGETSLAPNTAFNSSQEHTINYPYNENKMGHIGSVNYWRLTTVNPSERVDGRTALTTPRHPQDNFKIVRSFPTAWTEWSEIPKADSPDNYPGGKYGKNPDSEPAIDSSGNPYAFEFGSQQDYVDSLTRDPNREVEVSGNKYRMSISLTKKIMETFYPHYAVAREAPPRESMYVSNWSANYNAGSTGIYAYD